MAADVAIALPPPLQSGGSVLRFFFFRLAIRDPRQPAAHSPMAEAEPTTTPTDYIRVKRKKVTIFLYMEPGDTVHDLRARVNHITKVPTTDVKFFIDINGEVPVDENKSLSDQKVRRPRCNE